MGLKTIRFTYPKFARRSQVLQVFLAAIVLYSQPFASRIERGECGAPLSRTLQLA